MPIGRPDGPDVIAAAIRGRMRIRYRPFDGDR
jgi:hypothetical protein